MKRAWKLLKACNTLNNPSSIMISRIMEYITYIMLIMSIQAIIEMIVGNTIDIMNYNKVISYISTIMIILIMRSVNTTFSVDRRLGTKKDLSAITMHLPVSKMDFVLAQYMENLYLYFPAFLLIVGIIVANILLPHPILLQFEVGFIVLIFSFTYVVSALGSGILTFYYLDPRVREAGYLVPIVIWFAVFLFTQGDRWLFIIQIIEQHQGCLWFKWICDLSQTKGLILFFISVMLGYFNYVRIPKMLEGRNT